MGDDEPSDDVQNWMDFFEGVGRDAVEEAQEREQYDNMHVPEPVVIDWQLLQDHYPKRARELRRRPDSESRYAKKALSELHSMPASIRVRNLGEKHQKRVDHLRSGDLDSLVSIDVEVIEVNPIEPFLNEATWECQRCGTLTDIPTFPFEKVDGPAECQGCEQSGPFNLHQRLSKKDDCQRLKVVAADSPLDSPRKLRVFLRNDLCGRLRKGQRVTIVGEYNLLPFSHPKQKSTNMLTHIEGVGLETENDAAGGLEDSELGDIIVEVVDEHEEPDATDDESWYIEREAVVDYISSRQPVSETDVEEKIDDLETENDIIQQGSRLAPHSNG